MIDSVINFILDRVDKDFIAAKGVSGGWCYIKYNSGLAICWKSWVDKSVPYNSLPNEFLAHAHKFEWTLPFSFTEPPNVIATCNVGSGYSYTFTYPHGTSKIGIYTVGNHNATGGLPVRVQAIVTGFWKTFA